MRLVFFNHSHPQTKNVSGVRLWGFAKALARRGHRVIHVTATLDGGRSTCGPSELQSRLAEHSWTDPFHLAVEPSREWMLRMIRREALPSLVRKPLTAYCLVFRGGVYFDWTKRLGPYLRSIASCFEPDLAWATFGNTSSLAAAQAMARLASCPLAVDVKDSVFDFLPKGMRILMARRYGASSAATVNSKVLLSSAKSLTGREAEVIYSGVDAAFYEAGNDRVGGGGENTHFLITLTGSLRSSVRLREFLSGCRRLRERLAGTPDVNVVYAGNGRAEIEAACKELGIRGWVRCEDYLSTSTLASLARSADVNAYISVARASFHHKFLELVATGKPVIAYGGELEESLDLVRGLEALVFDPADAASLDEAFRRILGADAQIRQRKPISTFGWDTQARGLESVFRKAIAPDGMAPRQPK